MSIILDLIVVAIFLLVVIISAKQGFVRIAVEVAGFIAVFIFVALVSSPLAELTYDKIIEPPIMKSASEIATENNEVSADAVWSELPEFVTENADKFGITKEKLQETIEKSESGAAKDIMATVSADYIKPVVITILETLYSVILIVVLLIVVKILATCLNKVFSFSVVGKLNKTLGGVLGVFKAAIIVLCFCKVIELIISFTDNGFWIFNNGNIEKTYIFKFLTNVF